MLVGECGTSIRGSMVPARACAEVAPNVPMAIAMASSKFLSAAVNDTEADWA